MPSRFYKNLEKGFYVFFYILIAGLFLRGEVFRIYVGQISIKFTSVKNFVLVFILWWLALRGKKKLKISKWLLLVLILEIYSILLSLYPEISLKAGYVLAIYILWFYGLWYILRENKFVVNTIIFFIALAGIVNILNLYFHYTTDLGEILEKYPFWEGKNALGLFLVMALCVSGSLVCKGKWIWLTGLNSILITLGVVFSYSRSAWIACAFSVLGLVIYKFKRAIWILLGSAAIILIISPSLVSERFNSIFKRDDANVKIRLEVWKHTIKMVENKPIIGTGLGTFTKAYRDNYPDKVPLKGEGARIIRHAHNLYLQILAETGVIGLGIFLFLIFNGLFYGIRNFIREKSPLIKSIRYGSLLGILVFLIYSVTDCTIGWEFIGDSFSHINLIFLLLWVIVLRIPCEK